MTVGATREGFLELQISDEADWAEFEQLVRLLSEQLPARVVERLDGLDQRYWDLEVGGIVVTLHLEHYLGMSLYANDAEGGEIIRRAATILEREKYGSVERARLPGQPRSGLLHRWKRKPG